MLWLVLGTSISITSNLIGGAVVTVARLAMWLEVVYKMATRFLFASEYIKDHIFERWREMYVKI